MAPETRARRRMRTRTADGRDIVEMLLIADGSEELGFVENAQEFRTSRIIKSKKAEKRSISCWAACVELVRARMNSTISSPIFGKSASGSS